MSAEASPITISVIIPAYNAEGTLAASLESVFESRGVTFEVLLVNDASTDATEAIARRYPCRIVTLKQKLMAANCRNLGAELARGETLVFFDADQLMLPDTLRRYQEELEAHPEVDAIVGSLAADTPIPGFFSKFKNFLHYYTHQTAEVEGATLASGLAAVRRDVFMGLGGFEPAFSGASIEDIALGYRMRSTGHRIRFAPDIQVVHLKGYTLRSMIRSDVLHRAIPWTGLMLRERMFRSDLNTRGGNVVSVVLAWLFPAALIVSVTGSVLVGGVGAVVSLFGIWLANVGLLRASGWAFGWGFALRAAVFLPAMYFYQGLGLLMGIVVYLKGGSVAESRERPQPRYEVLEGGGARPQGR